LTPGVVSQTPACPGSLYRIVTFVGVTIVLTPCALAGICRALKPGIFMKALVPLRQSSATTVKKLLENMAETTRQTA